MSWVNSRPGGLSGFKTDLVNSTAEALLPVMVRGQSYQPLLMTNLDVD